MHALRIENISESDPHRYEATKAVTKKAQKKKSEASTEVNAPINL